MKKNVSQLVKKKFIVEVDNKIQQARRLKRFSFFEFLKNNNDKKYSINKKKISLRCCK